MDGGAGGATDAGVGRPVEGAMANTALDGGGEGANTLSAMSVTGSLELRNAATLFAGTFGIRWGWNQ
jgi:hypothetical protein